MPYSVLDKLIGRLRFRAALPHIRAGTAVCDIGCGLDARFLTWAGDRIGFGLGLDVQVGSVCDHHPHILKADISKTLPLKPGRFDHVVMLAVLEHLSEPSGTFRELHRILKPNGSLIMTWPNTAVDPIVHFLHRIKLVSQEMESQEHKPRMALGDLMDLLRSTGFGRFYHRTFELGMNNMMVAFKTGHVSGYGVRS